MPVARQTKFLCSRKEIHSEARKGVEPRPTAGKRNESLHMTTWPLGSIQKCGLAGTPERPEGPRVEQALTKKG